MALGASLMGLSTVASSVHLSFPLTFLFANVRPALSGKRRPQSDPLSPSF